MAPYLGMTAHAIILRADDRVFAHIHPGGTIPYGFPSPGLYRVFIQMKHGTRVETAAFDLPVY